jgi:LL-diaminopimelate aminotransferase
VARINEGYARLRGSYLFVEVANRVAAARRRRPERGIISMGIGDVTRPLVPAVIGALHAAVEEMGRRETFRGYGPEQGYAFLREAVAEHDYSARGIAVGPGDIHISDGAKPDIGNFQELFSPDAVIAVTDPVYPVYVDSNIMAGRGGEWREPGWSSIVYLPCTGENDFVPSLPDRVPDLIYLCYPNNPTGTVLTREHLSAWVAYAREHDCVILYDSAYEAFITDPAVPHSIFEVPGALDVAVEFRSFSKTAGFTGLRCAYVVIPPAVAGRDGRGRAVPLAGLWSRRQSTKYNGCPYIVQRAAAAVYEPEGRAQIREVIGAYQENARHILHTLAGCGLRAVGGVNAPYVWTATPQGMPSWDFFDLLLQEAGVVCTPGAGFGPSGEGWARFTAFASADDTRAAMQRLRDVLGRNAPPKGAA